MLPGSGIFSAEGPPSSIVCAGAFHFRVRDGNGWSDAALTTKEHLSIPSAAAPAKSPCTRPSYFLSELSTTPEQEKGAVMNPREVRDRVPDPRKRQGTALLGIGSCAGGRGNIVQDAKPVRHQPVGKRPRGGDGGRLGVRPGADAGGCRSARVFRDMGRQAFIVHRLPPLDPVYGTGCHGDRIGRRARSLQIACRGRVPYVFTR